MRYGLMGALGAVMLSLTTDKRNYQVGDVPVYTLQAAIPGSRVLWSSFKNQQSTGEFQADYGQTVDANGTAQLSGGAWTDAQTGQWEKQVLIIAPDGSMTTAQVLFNVAPKPAAATTTPPPASAVSGGFLAGSVNILGFELPKVVAYGGGALLAYSLLGKRGR